MPFAGGAVVDIASRKQGQDLLLDLSNELAVSGRVNRITVVGVGQEIDHLPVRWHCLPTLLAGRLQDVHLDSHTGKRVRPPELSATPVAHLNVVTRSQFDQNLPHLVLQSVAGVLRGKPPINELKLLRRPYGRLAA